MVQPHELAAVIQFEEWVHRQLLSVLPALGKHRDRLRRVLVADGTPGAERRFCKLLTEPSEGKRGERKPEIA
jgi:hypothetical protein